MSLLPTEKEILEVKIKELLSINEMLQAGIQAMGEMIKEKDQCIHDLKTALLYAGDKAAELEANKYALISDNYTLREEIQNNAESVEDLEIKYNSTRKQNSRLESNLNEKDREITDKNYKIEELEDKVKDLEREKRNLEDEVYSLEKKLKDAESRRY